MRGKNLARQNAHDIIDTLSGLIPARRKARKREMTLTGSAGIAGDLEQA
jgi:hypothetical protein